MLGFNDQSFFADGLASNEYHFDEWIPCMDEVLQTQYLYIGVKGLCVDLIEAAECFLENNPNFDFPELKMNQGGG